MDGLGQVLPYLQEAALPPQVRAALNREDVELDKIRDAIAKAASIEELQLAEVRRVTWKSLLSYAMLGVAAYTLIGTLGGLDLATFADSLRDASWWWLLAVLIVAQLPRPANALSSLGSTMTRIPFGPATALQFAKTYVSLAVPTSAGQIAVTTRFFQRFGVPAAAALSAGVIDSVSEMIVQLVVFVIAISTSDTDVGMSISPEQLRGIAVTAGVIALVVAVAAGIVLLIPSLRRRLIEPLRQAREAGRVLRSPGKLLLLFGGNFLSQVLFACALWCCVHAFGEDVSLGTLLLVNTVVSLFAGLHPGARRCRRDGGRPRARPGPRRRHPVGTGARDRPHLPLRDRVPAADLGPGQLPLADRPSLPHRPLRRRQAIQRSFRSSASAPPTAGRPRARTPAPSSASRSSRTMSYGGPPRL